MLMYANLKDEGKILKKIYGTSYNLLIKILSPSSYNKSKELMDQYISQKGFNYKMLAIGSFVSFVIPAILTPALVLIILFCSFFGYAQLAFSIIIFIWQSSWVLAIINLLKLKLTYRFIKNNEELNFLSSVKNVDIVLSFIVVSVYHLLKSGVIIG